MVALTFDDGPDEVHTPRLLELLAERGVRATFFVFGDKARRHPDLIARALADGHAIEPHCWADHESHHRLSEAELDEEIARTLDALAGLGCPTPTVWRPPYGDIRAPESYDVAARHGLRLVTWTLDTRDWDAEHPLPAPASRPSWHPTPSCSCTTGSRPRTSSPDGSSNASRPAATPPARSRRTRPRSPR